MTAPTTYELGATLAGMATMSAIGAINPESQFIDYAEVITLADGAKRGMGLPQASWHFGYLTPDQYDAIKSFVAGIGASVFIATVNSGRAFVRYECVIELPDRFVLRNEKYIDVTINFSQLVEAE
jgi:hypothetical protein